MSDEGFQAVSSEKLQEANKTVEEMKAQLRIMEARNIRISTENTKLNETVRQAQDMINESRKASKADKKEQVISEQKERTTKAANVTGRGKTSGDAEVLAEYAAPQTQDMDQMLVLSGLKQVK
jgi:regulator of replication initiation timing